MARLLLFGPARKRPVRPASLPGTTVSAIIAAAEERFGEEFSEVLADVQCLAERRRRPPDAPVNDGDEVAVIPPVSGG